MASVAELSGYTDYCVTNKNSGRSEPGELLRKILGYSGYPGAPPLNLTMIKLDAAWDYDISPKICMCKIDLHKENNIL